MDNALADVVHGKIGTPKSAAFAPAFQPGCVTFHRKSFRPVGCRYIVVCHCQCPLRRTDSAPGITQTSNAVGWSLREQGAGRYIQTGTVILLMHNMRIPDFIKQCFWSRHDFLLLFRRGHPPCRSGQSGRRCLAVCCLFRNPAAARAATKIIQLCAAHGHDARPSSLRPGVHVTETPAQHLTIGQLANCE